MFSLHLENFAMEVIVLSQVEIMIFHISDRIYILKFKFDNYAKKKVHRIKVTQPIIGKCEASHHRHNYSSVAHFKIGIYTISI